VLVFADPSAADAAADLFEGHPWAGAFLEVKLANDNAVARLTAALADLTATPASKAPQVMSLGRSRKASAPPQDACMTT
jgi:hypothetical protein